MPPSLRRRLAALLLGLALPGTGLAETAETALARSVLAGINPVSISKNVEYCGYIGRDATGALIASVPRRGQEAYCWSDPPPEMVVVTASWHTHGGHSPDYFNEVPSVQDYEADEDEGIDGYIATPGGRLWYIDTTDGVMVQLCGIGCLPMDPAFRLIGKKDPVAQSYTYLGLVQALGK